MFVSGLTLAPRLMTQIHILRRLSSSQEMNIKAPTGLFLLRDAEAFQDYC